MPSCLFTNAKVFTGRSETEFATAFTVKDGKIAWVSRAGDAGNAPQLDADRQVDDAERRAHAYAA